MKQPLLKILAGALIVACGLAALAPRSPVSAQAGNVYDLIGAVNAYRAANGLDIYPVDGTLMSLAQSQSDYMASIQTCTHLRADGSGPQAPISAENVACGINMSVTTAIYSDWSDALHSATILGPDEGLVGAGVATVGTKVFYTLDVKLVKGSFAYRPPKQPTAPALVNGNTVTPNPQVVPIGPLVTTTPLPDGSIKHVIQFGETLVMISKAYGVALTDLYALNRWLDPTNPVYYAGQVLVIHAAPTPTLTATATNTSPPPTNTPAPTRTPRPTATITASPTPVTPTPRPFLGITLQPERAPVYAVILLSALGVLWVVVRGFTPPKK